MVAVLAILVCMCVAETRAEATPPYATLSFPGPVPAHRMTVEITTASKAVYAIPLGIDENGESARNQAFRRFLNANWVIEKVGHFGIKVYGVRTKGGETDAVRALIVTARKEKGRESVKLEGTGEVKVDVRAPDEKPAAKPPPTGPNLGPEPFVEFDLTPFPSGRAGWTLMIRAETERTIFHLKTGPAGQGGMGRFELCEAFTLSMLESGYKAETVDKLKIRVYGAVHEGKFYPASKGIVESPEVGKDELPKVTIRNKGA